MAGTIRKLDQVRALSDPLRLRIVEALAGEERTVMQVARLLHRKPTGLYHHVRVLEAAGLVRLVREQQKRGTVERYYRTVHADLRIDPRVFKSRRSATARRDVLTGVLDAAVLDVRQQGDSTQPMLALRLGLDLDASRLAELESVLRSWAASHVRAEATSYAITLVAHPAGARPPTASDATPASVRRARPGPQKARGLAG